MTDLRKAAEMALEAMEKYCECGGLEDPIEELRQALAQEQRREWVELTNEDIHTTEGYEEDRKIFRFAKALLAKAKEKNT